MKKFIVFLAIFICIKSLAYSIEWERYEMAPSGGYITQIIKDNYNDMYAVSNNRIYTQFGLNPIWMNIANPNFEFTSLYVSNSNVFFALGSIYQDSLNRNRTRLYRSVNTLNNWEDVSASFDGIMIYEVQFKGNDIYICTDRGVYKSSNNGEGWELEISSQSTVSTKIFRLRFFGDNSIIIQNSDGLFKRNAQDTNWSEIDYEELGEYVTNIVTSEQDTIYLTTEKLGIFKSFDKGNSWTHITDGLSNYTNVQKLEKVDDTLMVSWTTNELYYSFDKGQSWTKSNLNNVRCILRDSNIILFGTSSGIYYTTSIKDSIFAEHSHGIDCVEFTGIIVNQKNNDIYYVAENNLYKVYDNGNLWKIVKQFERRISTFDFAPNGTMFVGTIWGGMFRSIDNGDTWEEINNGLDDPDVRSMVIDTSGVVYAGTFSDVYKSEDNGNTWTVLYHAEESLNTSLMAINKKTNVLFLSSNTYGTLRSANRGASWTTHNIGNTQNFIITAYAFGEGNTVFATTVNQRLYKSTNNGNTWRLLDSSKKYNNIFAVSNRDFIASVSSSNREYTWISHDTCKSWESANQGLNHYYLYSYDISPDGILYGYSFGRIFRTKQSVITSVDDSEISMNEFEAYPNPTYDYINFKEQIVGAISIYSVEGIKVLETVNCNRIDVADLPAGLYFIKYNGKMTKFVKN